MFVGAALFFVVLGMTILFGRRTEPVDMPLTETALRPAKEGWEPKLDRFRIWVTVSIVLIALAYGPFLVGYLPPKLLSRGYTFF